MADTTTAPPQGTDAAAQPAQAAQSVQQAQPAAPDAQAAQPTAPAQPAPPAPGQPVPVNPKAPHAGLVNMIQSLALGVDSFATAVATHGREGGVGEVQEYQAKQQQQKLQAQQAQRDQAEFDLRQKTMNANLLMQQMQYQHALMRFPIELKNDQLNLQNATIDEFTKEKNTGESMGYDMNDPAQSQEAKNRMGVGSAAQQPGAIVVPFTAKQQAGDVTSALTAALPPGKSLTDYKVLPTYNDNAHGTGGTVTLVPNDSPIMQMPATPRQVAASEAEVEGMITQGKALGLDKNDMFQRLSGQYDNIKKVLDGGGKPTTSQLFTMHQSVIGPLSKLVADTSDANKLAEGKAQSQQGQIKTQQEQIANQAYMRSVPKNAQGQPVQDFATWQAAQNKSVEQSIEQGDPNIVGDMLGKGLVSPDQVISSRNMSKAFYTQVIKAANASSMAATGQPFDMKAAAGQYTYVKEFNNPASKVQAGITAGNTFLEHANDLFGVTNGYRTTNVKALNTPLNKIRDAFGDPTYTQFAAAISPVKTEYDNALKAGYAPTAEDEKNSAVLLSDSSSPAQIEAAVKQMSHSVLRRLESTNQSYRTHTGVDYPNMISPDAAQAVRTLGLSTNLQSGGSFAGVPQRVNPGQSVTPQSKTQTPTQPPIYSQSGKFVSHDGGVTWQGR